MFWLIDHANVCYFLFGLAFLGFGAAWWQRRRPALAAGAIVSLGLILLLALLGQFVVTDKQQLELNVPRLGRGRRHR